MNNRHKQLEPFPKEQVRSAIQMGIEQAEKQRRKGTVNPQQRRRNKIKQKYSMLLAVWQLFLSY